MNQSVRKMTSGGNVAARQSQGFTLKGIANAAHLLAHTSEKEHNHFYSTSYTGLIMRQ